MGSCFNYIIYIFAWSGSGCHGDRLKYIGTCLIIVLFSAGFGNMNQMTREGPASCVVDSPQETTSGGAASPPGAPDG